MLSATFNNKLLCFDDIENVKLIFEIKIKIINYFWFIWCFLSRSVIEMGAQQKKKNIIAIRIFLLYVSEYKAEQILSAAADGTF